MRVKWLPLARSRASVWNLFNLFGIPPLLASCTGQSIVATDSSSCVSILVILWGPVKEDNQISTSEELVTQWLGSLFVVLAVPNAIFLARLEMPVSNLKSCRQP